MKNKLKIAVASLVLVLIFTSCQDIFTTSAFSFVETDISSMNNDQKVSYAEDLLSSGTTAQLAEAYAEIEALLPDDLSKADPDLVILAADLAIGSSGIGDAVTGALEVFASGEEAEEGAIDEIFASIDTENLADAVALIEAAEDMEGVVLTPEQYTNAAAAQVLVVLDQVSDLPGDINPSELDDTDPVQAAIIEDLEQALNWADAGGVDLSMFGEGIALPE